MDRVESMGWTVLFIYFITIIIKLSRKKYILFVNWANKQNIYELVFQLSYKQNISN